MSGRLNFPKWFGDNGPGCLWAPKITRFFRGFKCEIWPCRRVYETPLRYYMSIHKFRRGVPKVVHLRYSIPPSGISHIKPWKNLFISVAHRHPGPKSPFQMAKFKRPHVSSFCILDQPSFDLGWSKAKGQFLSLHGMTTTHVKKSLTLKGHPK